MRTIRTSMHSAAWIPRWTTANAPRALARAADLGFDHVVVPLRRFEDIDPPAIAKAFEQSGITPVNAAGQSPDADISSSDKAVRVRGLEHLRAVIRLARDMGSRHVGGVLYTALRKFDHAATPAGYRAAAEAIASLARLPAHESVAQAYSGRKLAFGPDYIIPTPFDPRLISEIAPAVARAAATRLARCFVRVNTRT